MRLLDFLNATHFWELTQKDKAALLLYYSFKETGKTEFTSKDIKALFSDAGQKQQLNISRIKKGLLLGEKIRKSKEIGNYEFVPVYRQLLDDKFERLWLGVDYIDSNNEVINEARYCGKRDTIDKLIKQINCCYAQHCFDACCVLMRRLFEVLLICSYQNYHIDDEIKDSNGNYYVLERIVGNAKNNKDLNLTRNRHKYDEFRNLGNFAAHNLYYISTIKEIDDIKYDYKAMMDELYQKAGFFK